MAEVTLRIAKHAKAAEEKTALKVTYHPPVDGERIVKLFAYSPLPWQRNMKTKRIHLATACIKEVEGKWYVGITIMSRRDKHVRKQGLHNARRRCMLAISYAEDKGPHNGRLTLNSADDYDKINY